MNQQTDFRSKHNFVLQQGFEDSPPESCGAGYTALLFQPRIVGIVVLFGVIFQSPIVFLILAAILWWNALVPRWNPFDTLYNRSAGGRPNRFPLPPAPEPRRFAQGMAGTFSLLIGFSLLFGWTVAALTLEVFLLLALAALIFGRFCLGSFIYHLIRGRSDFAKRTLPWA